MATNKEVLEESTRVAQEAAASVGGTFKQGEGFKPAEARTVPEGTAKDTTADRLLDQIGGTLMEQAGMVSSANTQIDEAISRAIGATQRGAAANTERIASTFDREIGFQEGELGAQRDQFFEGRRGFATSTAALERLNVQTEKTLRDLDQRKQELILQGESAAAAKIADLEVQALQFKQQATQQAFTNILSMGQLALQERSEQRAASQFKQNLDLQRQQLQFNKSATMADIATKYGVSVQPGDSLNDVVNRAKVTIQEDRDLDTRIKKAQLRKLNEEISDIESREFSLNRDSQLTRLITEEGLDPTDAVNRIATEILAVTEEPLSRQELSELQSKAMQIKEDYDASLSKEQAEQTEVLGGVLGRFFNKVTFGDTFQDLSDEERRRINLQREQAGLGPLPEEETFFESLFGS